MNGEWGKDDSEDILIFFDGSLIWEVVFRALPKWEGITQEISTTEASRESTTVQKSSQNERTKDISTQ